MRERRTRASHKKQKKQEQRTSTKVPKKQELKRLKTSKNSHPAQTQNTEHLNRFTEEDISKDEFETSNLSTSSRNKKKKDTSLTKQEAIIQAVLKREATSDKKRRAKSTKLGVATVLYILLSSLFCDYY